jgi:hypothetical protein
MTTIALILLIIVVLQIALNVNIMFIDKAVIIFYGRKNRQYLHIKLK